MARKSLTPKQSLFVGITLFSMFFGAGNLILPPLLGHRRAPPRLAAMAGFLVTGIGLPMLGIVAVGLAGTVRELASRVTPVRARVRRRGVPCHRSLPGDPPHLVHLVRDVRAAASHRGLAGDRAPRVLGRLLRRRAPARHAPQRPHQAARPHHRPRAHRPARLRDRVGAARSRPFAPGCAGGLRRRARHVGIPHGLSDHGPARLAHLRHRDRREHPRARRHRRRRTGARGLARRRVRRPADGRHLLRDSRWSASISPPTCRAPPTVPSTPAASAGAHFGTVGTAVVAAIFLLACLNVCIGLISCCGSYFADEFPRVPYRAWAIGFAVFSCVVSNFGLDAILTFSVPLLNALYPMAIVLVLMGMMHKGCDLVPCVWPWGCGAHQRREHRHRAAPTRSSWAPGFPSTRCRSPTWA